MFAIASTDSLLGTDLTAGKLYSKSLISLEASTVSFETLFKPTWGARGLHPQLPRDSDPSWFCIRM